MPRILCVLDQRWTWKGWLERNRRNKPVLTFDPSVLPARVTLQRDGSIHAWRFVGTTSPARNPISVMGGSVALSYQANEDWIGFIFDPGQNLILNQLAVELSQALRVTQVIVPKGSGLDAKGWPVGAEPVELEEGYPSMVREAQRRAQWLDVLQASEDHVVELTEVSTLGARLGAGEVVPLDRPDALCWKYGQNLHLVSERPPGEPETARLLSWHKAKTLSHATPVDYEGLVCSLADQEGNDLGIGAIESLEVATGTLKIKNTAVAPAHARLLRLGTTRIDAKGREQGEVKPWSL